MKDNFGAEVNTGDYIIAPTIASSKLRWSDMTVFPVVGFRGTTGIYFSERKDRFRQEFIKATPEQIEYAKAKGRLYGHTV